MIKSVHLAVGSNLAGDFSLICLRCGVISHGEKCGGVFQRTAILPTCQRESRKSVYLPKHVPVDGDRVGVRVAEAGQLRPQLPMQAPDLVMALARSSPP